ncbi:cell wall hydrolase [Pseudohoeflea coraliihabitans]|uniref:Cell wall hydrolase n=1 Tax=Pseudohoeflea coraliihabitans TaxID=2860393 RepID=A0ABS6WU83_9HYPH|nr:cell wall hydrolase [Pseudohoeflea sp. DP4N28-3]MBW3099198.1 cell wall hydrolase [Pseudohoeflea sp. DP4N28-3]
MPKIANTVADVVLGEAVSGNRDERYEDMLHIASVISNRSLSLGITPQQVVANRNEFNAYGKKLPSGVERYRSLAEKALNQVATVGPVTDAKFYATPKAQHNLPPGLVQVTSTKGHNYFVDPLNRAVGTAIGYIQPSTVNLATGVGVPTPVARPDQATALASYAPTPEARPDMLSAQVAPANKDPGFAFKTNAARQGVADFAPEMSELFSEIARGLKDPGAYTVTSTSEPRPGLAQLTHVRDRGAVDFRTRDKNKEELDELVAAALYAPGTQSIAFNHNPKAPHMHVGTSAAYGAGLLPGSDTSRLSEDIADSLRSWSDSLKTGAEYAPPVPEALAPVPSAAPRSPSNVATPSPNANQTSTGRLSAEFSPAPASQTGLSPSQHADLTASLNQQAQDVSASNLAKDVLGEQLSRQAASIQSGTYAPDPDTSLRADMLSATPAPTNVSAPAAAAPSAAAAAAAPAPSDSYYNSPRGSQLAADDVKSRENLAKDVLEAALTKQAASVKAGTYAPPTDTSLRKDISTPIAAVAPPLAPPRTIAPPPTVTPYTPDPAPARAPAPKAPPANSAMDVWQGRAMTGTATNGNQVSRNPDGTVSMTSEKYGYTETMNPDGSYRSTTAPGLFGIDAAVRSMFSDINDPLAATMSSMGFNTGQQKAPTQPGFPAAPGTTGETKADDDRGFLESLFTGENFGRLAGATIGAALLGPTGAALGAKLGGQVGGGRSGQQQESGNFFSDVLGGLFGGNAGGFPDAPTGSGTFGGYDPAYAEGFAEAARSGALGAQAQAAANNPGGGLY